jgi:hypothetical protein
MKIIVLFTKQFCFCLFLGVPAPPGSHTMMSAPTMAAAPSPFRSPGGGTGGMLRTSPWPPAAHAPEGIVSFFPPYL